MKTTGDLCYATGRLFSVAILCCEQEASLPLFGRAEANSVTVEVFPALDRAVT